MKPDGNLIFWGEAECVRDNIDERQDVDSHFVCNIF